MKRLLMVLAALAVLALAACGGGDDNGGGGGQSGSGQVSTVTDGTLTVGSDIPFAPFEFRDGDKLTGFDVELVNEMAKRVDLKPKYVDTAFDTIFTQLAAGRFDVVASATTITEERKRQVSFTEPYYSAQQALTVNADKTPEVTSVDSLPSGSVLAVQTGTTGEKWARENAPDGVEVRSFPEAPDTYTALEGGQVAGVIFDEPSAIAEARKRKSLKVVEAIDTGERYGFGVDPRNDELLKALNDALAEMKQDGTYERIYKQFEDLPPNGSILQAAE